MASDPEQATLSSLGKVGKSSGEIGGVEEPLLNGSPPAHDSDSYSVAAAILPFLFPALGGLLYGYDIGATSCATISVESATSSGISWYNLSSVDIGLITSGSLYGALIGSILAFNVADFLGRRKELISAALFYLVGAIVTAVAPNLPVMVIGRCVYGIGIGLVDLLKHGIADPSLLNPSPPQNSISGPEKDGRDKVLEGGEYMAAPIFVHAKLQDQDLAAHNRAQLKKAFTQYFGSSSFIEEIHGNVAKETTSPSAASNTCSGDPDSPVPSLLVIPAKNRDDSVTNQYDSYNSMLWKLRDQVLSMNHPSFSRAVSEREWLKNSAKIWEQVKNSAVIAEYTKTLQSSGLFRR